jgi:predicted DsbA family dithiol-disulfide isomerase
MTAGPHDRTDTTEGASASEASPEPLVTPRVLVFFDYSCQFCYLDWPRFKRLRAKHDAELFLVPFELRPQLPPEGIAASELGTGHSERVVEHMHRMARESGLELLIPDLIPNTHNALSLGEFARDLGPEAHEAVHEAIFSAYNARGEDIGDTKVLLRIAEERALDPSQVLQVFAEDRYDERLHQFYHLALTLGISATPSALICNELLIGSRPFQVLKDSLDRCLVTEHDLDEGVSVAEEDGSEGMSQADAEEGSPATIDR